MSSRAQGPDLAPCVSVPELQVACKHLWNPATLSPPPDPPSSLLSPSYPTGRLLASFPFRKPHGLCTPYLQDLLLSSHRCPQTAALYGWQTPGSPDMCAPFSIWPLLPQKHQRLTPCGIPPSCTRARPTRPEVHEWGLNCRARCAEGSGGLLLPPLMPHLFRTDFRWP